MLQKIVNGIAIASGVVSLTVVGAAGYVFIRKDAIIDNIKSKVIESVLPGGLGTGALGGALDSAKTWWLILWRHLMHLHQIYLQQDLYHPFS